MLDAVGTLSNILDRSDNKIHRIQEDSKPEIAGTKISFQKQPAKCHINLMADLTCHQSTNPQTIRC